MSKENENPPTAEPPVSPAIVKKASGTTATPKPKPAIPAVPAARPQVEAQNVASQPSQPAETNPFSIFGWGD